MLWLEINVAHSFTRPRIILRDNDREQTINRWHGQFIISNRQFVVRTDKDPWEWTIIRSRA